MPLADQVHGAVQDGPHDRQHFNVANNRLADYRELHDVSDLYIHGLSSFARDQSLCHQYPAVSYVYPNIGLAQGALEHDQVIDPVCTYLPLMHILPTEFPAELSRKPWFGMCPSGYCTRPSDRLS